MLALLKGESVVLPRYNFKTGEREWEGQEPLTLEKSQPIIVEGIHGLNEKLTAAIPRDYKFKIYVSALTQLNIDAHNRIPTTDARLIRRLVRDYQFRGASALKPLKQWPDVPEYTKARRLLDFCQYFLDLPDEDDVPNNSILREFIGKSVFFKGEDQV